MTPKSRSTPSFEEGGKEKIECLTLVIASALARRDLFTDPENMNSLVAPHVRNHRLGPTKYSMPWRDPWGPSTGPK